MRVKKNLAITTLCCLALGLVFGIRFLNVTAVDRLPNCEDISNVQIEPTELTIGEKLTLSFDVTSGFAAYQVDRGDGELGDNDGSDRVGSVSKNHTYRQAQYNKAIQVFIKDPEKELNNWISCNLSPNITVKTHVCGDGKVSTGYEECDGELGCSSICKREAPSSNNLTLTVSPRSGDAPLPVKATFGTRNDNKNVTPDWIDRGDGTTGSVADLTELEHTYQNPGNYTVTLHGKNIGNEEITGSISTTVNVYKPVICGDSIKEGNEECDDGNTADGDGCSSTCRLETPSCENITFNISPKTGRVGTLVTATFTGIPNWAHAEEITWGDGNYDNNPSSGITHEYVSVGTHTPKLVIYNSEGGYWESVECELSGSEKNIIIINNCGNKVKDDDEECDGDLGCLPICKREVPGTSNLTLNVAPNSGYAPLPVKATFGTRNDNKNVTPDWIDRGDGTTGSVADLTKLEHTYQNPGNYTVTLHGKNVGNEETAGSISTTVTVLSSTCGNGEKEGYEICDGEVGCSSICTREIPSSANLFLNVDPNFGNSPLLVNTLFGTLSGNKNIAPDWIDRGDGTTGSVIDLTGLQHTYTQAGIYTVTLHAINTGSGGVKGSIVKKDVVTVTTPSRGEWSGGGGKVLKKDYCPNGDFSPSYYDNNCGFPLVETRVSSGTKNTFKGCVVQDTTKYPKDVVGAFLRAYEHKITTMCPIETANLEGALLRRHMAKMISEFAIQILDMKPNTLKKCEFPDAKYETEEMRYYIKLACQLGIMGYRADGITKKQFFEGGKEVSKAQFGTLLSRLIWRNEFDNDDDVKYYTKHFENLTKTNILEQKDTYPPKETAIRGDIFKILKKAYEYKMKQK